MPTTQEGGISLSRLVDCCLIGLPLCLSKEPVSEEAVVKLLIQQRRQEHGWTADSLRVKAATPMLTSEALPVIGVAPVPIGAMRSGGVSGSSTVTFWRHPAANPEDRSLSCRFRSDCSNRLLVSRPPYATVVTVIVVALTHNCEMNTNKSSVVIKHYFSQKTHSARLVEWNICRNFA